MSDKSSCSSRHFSWLAKTCILNHQYYNQPIILHTTIPIPTTKKGPTIATTTATTTTTTTTTTISSLPDELVVEILSRVPQSSLPSLSLVSRRWSHLLLLHSTLFLLLRRRHRLVRPTLFTLSPHTLHFSTLPLHHSTPSFSWTTSPFPLNPSSVNLDLLHALLLQSRFVAIGRRVFIIGRDTTLEYDAWTGSLKSRPPMLSPRKKFAAAAVKGRIYIAGGSARVSTVEEYDPEKETWRVVSNAPRRRYGCIGVGVEADGLSLFCVVGGLKIGAACCSTEPSRALIIGGTETQKYANSMDVYDLEGRCWWRWSRGVPGGGCVVAACGLKGAVYVLASHAVEVSFWRCSPGQRKGGGVEAAGEWCRMRSPPVRLDAAAARFGCVGVEDKVVLVQVNERIVFVFDCVGNEWSRGPELPDVVLRAACVCVEC